MTEWNPLYLSHIGRVKASYILSAPDLDPDEITKQLSMMPDYSCRRGDPRINNKGEVFGTTGEPEGAWLIDSSGIDSKDLNEHIGSLISRVGSRQEIIARLVEYEGVSSFFDVLWESTYLYAGTGPILIQGVVDGMARLKASIGFDIYQIDSEEEDL